MRTFEVNGVPIPYFAHHYNCGGQTQACTERAVEVAIVLDWLDCTRPKDILEIGCVLPHYGYEDHEVIDLYEQYPGVKNEDACQWDYRDRHVVSISTLEHIDTGDNAYLLHRIINESISCCLTIPLGFLTRNAAECTQELERTLYRRVDRGMIGKAQALMFSRENKRDWVQVPFDHSQVIEYGALHQNANSIAVIIK